MMVTKEEIEQLGFEILIPGAEDVGAQSGRSSDSLTEEDLKSMQIPIEIPKTE